MTTNAPPRSDSVRQTPPRGLGWLFVVAALLLLLLLLGGGAGGYVWWRQHPQAPVTDPPPLPPPGEMVCNDETDPKLLKKLDFGQPLATRFDRGPLDALADRDISPIEIYPWQPQGLVAVLGEHRMRGHVFAVNPEGTLLAVASSYHAWLRIGKLETLHESVVVACPAAAIAMAWAPDGATLAVAGTDNQVRLYDVQDPTRIPEPRVLQAPGNLAPSLAFSGDGNYLLAGGAFRTDPSDPLRGYAWVWDLKAKTPAPVKKLPHSAPVQYVAFSPVRGDYRALTAGGPGDGQLHLWDALDEKQLGAIDFRQKDPVKKDKETRVGEVAFSPDGKRALSAHTHPTNPAQGNWSVRLWDLDHFKEGQELHILDGHVGGAALAFSPDGRHVATGRYNDGGVWLWDVSKEKGKEAVRRLATPPVLYALRFVGEKGERLVYASSFGYDHNIHVHQVETGRELSRPLGHLAGVNSVAVAPDGKAVASTGSELLLRLWDLKTVEQRFAVGCGLTWAVDFHPNARQVYYYGPSTASLPFVDVEKGSDRSPPYQKTHSGPIYTAAVTRDGRYAVTGGYSDATVRMWRLSDGVQVRWFALPPERPELGVSMYTTLCPDMLRVVVAGGGKTRLLHLRCQEIRHEWPALYPLPTFLPDARVALFGGPTASVWQVQGDAPREEETIPLNLAGAGGLRLSADGRRAATLLGGKVVVYDLKPVKTVWEWAPPPHFGGVAGVGLSADGRHLVTANGDGTVYVISIP